MRVKVEDKSSFCSQTQAEKLETALNRLLSDEVPSGVVIPIEIKDKPSLLSRLRRFLGTRSLKPSSGEVERSPKRKVILYRRAFEGDFDRLMHIALHEIGHYLDFDYHSQPDREKRADAFAEKFGYGESTIGE